MTFYLLNQFDGLPNWRLRGALNLGDALTGSTWGRQFDLKEKNKKVHDLEQCIYEEAKKKESHLASEDVIAAAYQMVVFRVCCHLDTGSFLHNVELAQMLKSGQVELKDLATATPMDMAPALYQDIAAKLQPSEDYTRRYCSLYKCSKCGESKCMVQARQVRSLDEGHGLDIECVNCHHRWFYG